MSISIAFWVLFIIGFVFGGYGNRTNLKAWATGDLVYWVLFALLGWATFGAPVHR